MPARFPRHLGLVGLLLAALLAVAGCDASAPSITPTAPASVAPTEEPTPEPTKEPTEPPTIEATDAPEPTTAGGDRDLSAAAGALSDVTSYKFDINISGGQQFAGLPGNSIGMAGTAVFEPEQAVVFTLEGIEGLDALGAGGEAPSFLIVGEDVYLGIGGTYLPIPTTGEQSAQFESLFDALRPETLLGSVTGEVQGMEEVGTETKNGVSAVHLQADEATRDALAEQFGAEADFPFDAWVAEDGDYLVSLEMGNPGSEDEFGISINISDVDDPGNVVERP